MKLELVGRIAVALALTYLAACTDSLATVQTGGEEDLAYLLAGDDPIAPCPGPAFLDQYLFDSSPVGVWEEGDPPIDSVIRLDVQAMQRAIGSSKHEITLGFRVGLSTDALGPKYWVDDWRTRSTQVTPGCSFVSDLARFTLEIPHVNEGGTVPGGTQRWIVWVEAYAEGKATANDGRPSTWKDSRWVEQFVANIPKTWSRLCMKDHPCIWQEPQ